MEQELSLEKLRQMEMSLKLQLFDLREQQQGLVMQERDLMNTLGKIRYRIGEIVNAPTPENIKEALGDTGEGEDTQDDADPPAEV